LKFRKTRFRGRNIYTVRPPGGNSGTHILFFHGGGYINGFHLPHWALIRTLVTETRCTIIAPDYPLAPKATYKEVFEMVVPMYEKLVRKTDGSKVILMGDSAGGGIALAVAQKMKKAKRVQPGQIILISPWLDVTLQNKKVEAVDGSDPMLNIEGLRKIGKAYAGDKDPEFYLVSPINGPVDGLGIISIFIGTKDILSADALKFKELAEAKGAPVRYFEYKDMIHDWVLYELPESRQAVDQIVSLIME